MFCHPRLNRGSFYIDSLFQGNDMSFYAYGCRETQLDDYTSLGRSNRFQLQTQMSEVKIDCSLCVVAVRGKISFRIIGFLQAVKLTALRAGAELAPCYSPAPAVRPLSAPLIRRSVDDVDVDRTTRRSEPDMRLRVQVVDLIRTAYRDSALVGKVDGHIAHIRGLRRNADLTIRATQGHIGPWSRPDIHLDGTWLTSQELFLPLCSGEDSELELRILGILMAENDLPGIPEAAEATTGLPKDTVGQEPGISATPIRGVEPVGIVNPVEPLTAGRIFDAHLGKSLLIRISRQRKRPSHRAGLLLRQG